MARLWAEIVYNEWQLIKIYSQWLAARWLDCACRRLLGCQWRWSCLHSTRHKWGTVPGNPEKLGSISLWLRSQLPHAVYQWTFCGSRRVPGIIEWGIFKCLLTLAYVFLFSVGSLKEIGFHIVFYRVIYFEWTKSNTQRKIW